MFLHGFSFVFVIQPSPNTAQLRPAKPSPASPAQHSPAQPAQLSSAQLARPGTKPASQPAASQADDALLTD